MSPSPSPQFGARQPTAYAAQSPQPIRQPVHLTSPPIPDPISALYQAALDATAAAQAAADASATAATAATAAAQAATEAASQAAADVVSRDQAVRDLLAAVAAQFPPVSPPPPPPGTRPR